MSKNPTQQVSTDEIVPAPYTENHSFPSFPDVICCVLSGSPSIVGAVLALLSGWRVWGGSVSFTPEEILASEGNGFTPLPLERIFRCFKGLDGPTVNLITTS